MDKTKKLIALAVALVLSVVIGFLFSQTSKQGHNSISEAMEQNATPWFETEHSVSQLTADFKAGKIAAVGISPVYALVTATDNAKYYVRIDTQHRIVQELFKEPTKNVPVILSINDVAPSVGVVSTLGQFLKGLLNLPTLISLALLIMIGHQMSEGGLWNPFKNAEIPEVTFNDVVGVADAKDALQDIVAYLKDPQKFSKLGARPPAGVILTGPPGTGKTLLAQALAGEAGTSFISVSGSDFSSKFYGGGISRVKALFKKARSQAPCVIFIDEIDGLGRRGSGESAAESEHNRIINSILVELDGFSTNSGVIVVGATNNLRNLDQALIRNGRFDRTCYVGLPGKDDRELLLKRCMEKVTVGNDIDLPQLARRTAGLSPAAIADIVNSAALQAAKVDAESVTQEFFRQATDMHLMGSPLSKGQVVLTEVIRHRIAVHEAGHALVAKVKGTSLVEKVSIIPRGKALGVTLISNEQDPVIRTQSEMMSMMVMLLAGRCAEFIQFKDYSSGAANDLERVTAMAVQMVTELGFSKNLGPLSYAGLPGKASPVGHQGVMNEVKSFILEAETEALAILTSREQSLAWLTSQLVEHETIEGHVVTESLSLFPAASVHSATNPEAIVSGAFPLISGGSLLAA